VAKAVNLRAALHRQCPQVEQRLVATPTLRVAKVLAVQQTERKVMELAELVQASLAALAELVELRVPSQGMMAATMVAAAGLRLTPTAQIGLVLALAGGTAKKRIRPVGLQPVAR
jgi:hypothetical protein